MTPSVRAPNGKLVVVLSAAPNPDYEERMWEGSVSIPPQRRVVSDLREASRAVREFIGANDLGGGNWTGGQVYDDAGRQIAHISYNGRAWEPGRWPTPEIKLAASRVAARRIASGADALIDQLADLAALDGALTAIEESFASHYGRVASTIRPEVLSHHDALSKSVKGLEQANSILKSAEAIVAAFPEDKTARRAVADAGTMVARFTRHVEEGRKIIRTLAQKQMPPDLKAAASKVKAALSKLLVDPSVLQVIPWVRATQAVVPGRYSSSWIDTVEFQYVFRIDGLPGRGRFEIDLREMPVGDPGVRFHDGMNPSPYTGPAQVVEVFDRRLQGWDGIVGQAEANVGRAQVAAKVKAALESALRRAPSAWDTDPVTVEGLKVSGAYRSRLPKEGASSVGEYQYERMVNEEIAAWRRILDPMLAPHMAGIASVRVSDGEKSWIYTDIRLK